MKVKILEIGEKIKKMIFTYPMVLLMSLIMTISTNYYIRIPNFQQEENFFLIKIILVSALGISLMFACKMLSQRIGKRLFIDILGFIFLVGFYFILPRNLLDFTEKYVFLLVPVFILSHLLVSFIAFISKENNENNFWQFNKNLFVHIFLTAVFTGVLIGGVELAILAIDNLFNIGFNEKVYLNTFFTLLIFGSTIVFLLFNEIGLPFLEKQGNYPVVLKFFTQFILIPLLFIYVIILCLYSGKILINWELPRGWVSYLILAYSVVGILALLLVHPLKQEGAKSWVRIFSKVFYFTLLPLLVLLFIAIFTRILEYSFTEARYYVLVLAVWLSTVVLYFIFHKNANIKFIPISLFLFGFFALTLPYFNAFSVSKRSQKKDLEKILIQNDLLIDGKINFDKKITSDVANEIGSKFDFLNQRNEKEYLLEFLDEKNKETAKNNRYWYMQSYFTNIDPSSGNLDFMTPFIISSKNKYFEVENYDYVISHYYMDSREVKINEDVFSFNYDDINSYKITLNGRQSIDYYPLILKLIEKYPHGSDQAKDLFVEFELGKYEIKIVFNHLNFSRENKLIENIWMENVLILIKERKEK